MPAQWGSVLALADDMTGALEIGASFRAGGMAVIVSLQPVPVASAPVLVFDTETRHLAPADAAAEVVRFIGAHRPRLIYKKTDSTLRGNISAELEAIAGLFPDWLIGYAPAYPAMGRTVTSGVLHVHGIALADTEFARDALNPVRTSSVAEILHPGLACTIFDAENDTQLAEAARAILSNPAMRIAAGPAGLAGMIALELGGRRCPPAPLPEIRTCLILNGSRHERSAMQMRGGEAPGWSVIGKNHEPGADAASVAAGNARYMVERIAAEKPDAIFVIGGDTAVAVVRELGYPSLTPVAEVLPGVPISLTNRGFYLITKAGGFGDSDVIARVRVKLSHD
jgi:uncharacterized protein YgbK (DUF1537 family)